MKFRRRLSDFIAHSPRLTALIVWVVWRRCPDARPGLYALLYRRNEGGDDTPTPPDSGENGPR